MPRAAFDEGQSLLPCGARLVLVFSVLFRFPAGDVFVHALVGDGVLYFVFPGGAPGVAVLFGVIVLPPPLLVAVFPPPAAGRPTNGLDSLNIPKYSCSPAALLEQSAAFFL